jgi:hypothetical protein
MQPRADGTPVATGPTSVCTMVARDEILLCDDADSGQRIVATLDELTLTYGVMLRERDGRGRCLRRHFASLADARAWAQRYARDRQPMRSRTHLIG